MITNANDARAKYRPLESVLSLIDFISKREREINYPEGHVPDDVAEELRRRGFKVEKAKYGGVRVSW